MHNYHCCRGEDLFLYIRSNLKLWVKPPWWGRDCPWLFTSLDCAWLNIRPQQGCVIFCTVTWCHLQCVQTSFIAVVGCLQPKGMVGHVCWCILGELSASKTPVLGDPKGHLSKDLLGFLILSFPSIKWSSPSVSHSINYQKWIPNLETYGSSFQAPCFPFLFTVSFGVSARIDSCLSEYPLCPSFTLNLIFYFLPRILNNQNLTLMFPTKMLMLFCSV